MKNISILGSTGSIGTQTLDVISRNKNDYNVVGLTANKNISLLEKQIRMYKPLKAAIADKALFNSLKISVADTDTEILCGQEGINEIASDCKNDILVSSLVGIAGLEPTLCAIKSKSDIALANKETLVTAGEYMINAAKENNVKLLPVDSEHSAVFQCLIGNKNKTNINRIILTASGGPFFGKTQEELKSVTLEDALKHPNWSMGQKITVDSATMMNKGLEVIEARWLFDMPIDKIDVVVHRQSIIHSMVEYTDGAILAQMGEPDMRVPISVALNYPEREIAEIKPFDFIKNSTLTFDEPDEETFKCLKLAKEALKIGGTMTAFLNGANEMANELFRKGKIGFLEIADLVSYAMENAENTAGGSLEAILEADRNARELVRSRV